MKGFFARLLDVCTEVRGESKGSLALERKYLPAELSSVSVSSWDSVHHPD